MVEAQTIASLKEQAQELIETLAVRTGGGKINLVTAPEYGADPTGQMDSTAAFAAALAGPAVAIIPPGIYRLNNLTIPSGSSIIGYSPLVYGNLFASQGQVKLLALDSACQRVINLDGKSNIVIDGVVIDCDYTNSHTRNSDCDGISAGGSMIQIRNTTIRMGRYGLGGAVPGGTGDRASNVVSAVNSQFFSCEFGVGDISDGWLTTCYLSYCRNGAVFTERSGSITLTGCRVEWNTEDGIQIGGASDTIISATTFDRNYKAGLYLDGTFKALISGCYFKRNGRNQDSDSCHVRLNSAGSINFSGCMSRHGADDGGTGPDTPAVWVKELGRSSNIEITSSDLDGLTGTAPYRLEELWDGNLPTDFIFSNNLGLRLDERVAGAPEIQSGFTYNRTHNVNVTESSNTDVKFFHDPIPQFRGTSHKIRVTSRNQTNGSMNVAEFSFLIQRESGTPTIVSSDPFGEIGSNNYINFGTGTISLSWQNIASDASSYELRISNTSPTSIHRVGVQVF